MKIDLKLSNFLAGVSALALTTASSDAQDTLSNQPGMVAGAEQMRLLMTTLQNRELTELTECDTVLATIPFEDIGATFDSLIDNFVPEGSRFIFKSIFAKKINYGVEVVKVCASCDEVLASSPDLAASYADNEAFNRYCGENVYGYDILHSGLIMYPLVEDGSIKDGTLPGYIYSRPSKASIFDGPSETFSSMTNEDFLFGFLATMANGAASIAPDFFGYGSSVAFRGYIVRDTYVTATLPLWLKLGSFLSGSTNCKTALADAAFYLGYSEGGYASVAIADGLHNALGVEPLLVMAGAGPYRIKDATLMQAIVSVDAGATEDSDNYIAALLGASYTDKNPSLAIGVGQSLLSNAFMDPNDLENNVFQWFADNLTQAEVNSKLANYTNETSEIEYLWNSTLVTFLRDAIENNVTNPCDESYSGYEVGVNDEFCAALAQNDLTEVLENVQYPVRLCHSVDDELVSYANLPDFSNPYLSLSEETGSHRDAGQACLIKGVFAIAATDLTSYALEDKHVEGGCSGDSEDPYASFLLKYGANGSINKKKCKWLTEKGTAAQKRICSSKKHQVRSEEDNLPSASVACFETCSNFCVRQFDQNKFLGGTKVTNGITVAQARTCKWLSKKSDDVIQTFCATTVEFDSIYGQAADVCTTTCQSCS